ncbi:glycoside hydrolase family 28 protein [Glaciecola sp. 1036]|uniref:glycoside hydrolase family 28 protein n=1 Tax=Alteromonadaceae TaxID=72275 RepID=UPI003D007CD3
MSNQIGRRQFLKYGAASLAAVPFLSVIGCSQAVNPVATTTNDWDQEIANIKARIKQPVFPSRQVQLTDYGVQPNSQQDVGDAIRQAIEELSSQGGGTLLIPEGKFFIKGPVHLKSNINFHLAEGAILEFSTDPDDYKPYVYTRWEGTELIGYSPLIYAFEQENIAITGKGTLDGGASEDNWWPWKGKWKEAQWGDHPKFNQKYTRDAIQRMAEDGVAVEERVFEDNYLRPPFIQPYRCRNVWIEGVTINRSPFWLVNPVLCKNVIVDGIHCESFGPNSDGCDPESCTDVLIQNCIFDTGDDCIAIKSGRNADGRRVNQPCENIIIENCQMKAGHGGIVIGSEISGGVRNLYAQDCVMSSPVLDRGIRIKTNSIRGGHLSNLNYRNIDIGQVKDAIVVNFHYEEGDVGKFPPKLENIRIDNLHVKNAKRAFMMRGYDHTPITGLSLTNITIENVEKPSIIENVTKVTQSNILIENKNVSI